MGRLRHRRRQPPCLIRSAGGVTLRLLLPDLGQRFRQIIGGAGSPGPYESLPYKAVEIGPPGGTPCGFDDSSPVKGLFLALRSPRRVMETRDTACRTGARLRQGKCEYSLHAGTLSITIPVRILPNCPTAAPSGARWDLFSKGLAMRTLKSLLCFAA